MGGLRWGFIDRRGDLAIAPSFDDAGHFSEGLAAVRVADRWGFIDSSGELVIPCRFDETEVFSDGLALVRHQGKRFFIDRHGESRFGDDWDQVSSFQNGYSRVSVQNRQAFLDTTGVVLGGRWYDYAEDFSDGLALVREKANGEHWYIDTTGTIRLRYVDGEYWLRSFHDGMACIESVQSGRQGFITMLGMVSIKPAFAEAGNFGEGLAAAKKSRQAKWGFIDKGGEWAISPAFDDTSAWFDEGCCAVQIGEKWGVIGLRGEEVLPCQFESTVDFAGGIATAYLDDETQLWDREGKLIKSYPKSVANWVGSFSDGGLAPISFESQKAMP